MTALAFDNVTRQFATPDGRVYRALEDITFSVPAGAFVAIVGPSGCGKSTLLNLAAGLLSPSSGVVRDHDGALAGLNRHATYMFQQDALLPWKTVRDNVGLGLVLAGASRPEARARADEWLTRVGLSAFGHHYPAQLSGGMRTRAAMAQHWIIDRRLLLMDEPFSALDVHTRLSMEAELLALWDTADRAAAVAAKKTVVFVTHDLEEAIALADEVIVLSAGPSARVVARHPVPLDRPRDLMDVRTTAPFMELHRELWGVLREEVKRSQRVEAPSRG